jgi:hypothetical protein
MNYVWFIDVRNVLDISSENEPLDVQTFVKKHMEKRFLCLDFVKCLMLDVNFKQNQTRSNISQPHSVHTRPTVACNIVFQNMVWKLR